MTIDLKALRKTAEAARDAGGTWSESWDYKRLSKESDDDRVVANAVGPQYFCHGNRLVDSEFYQPDKATREKIFVDAAHIAAFDPPTALAILDDRDQWQAQAEAAEAALAEARTIIDAGRLCFKSRDQTGHEADVYLAMRQWLAAHPAPERHEERGTPTTPIIQEIARDFGAPDRGRFQDAPREGEDAPVEYRFRHADDPAWRWHHVDAAGWAIHVERYRATGWIVEPLYARPSSSESAEAALDYIAKKAEEHGNEISVSSVNDWILNVRLGDHLKGPAP